ncbi:MAG: DHHA1 domain-containing protein [Azonexus sp.]|nr:DHHA1 domain-containing protein [Azonexus sp.]
MRHLVYYHADCLDGFGAAFAAWLALGDSAIYRAMHHGDRWLVDEVRDATVYLLDYTFSPASLDEMAGFAHAITVLDHHVSAMQQFLNPANDTVRQHESCDPEKNLRLHFDMDKSGVRLSWEHFHGAEPMPLPLRHIEDQDLWRFSLPGTRAFCRQLRLAPFDFNGWLRDITSMPVPETDAYQRALQRGEAIETFFMQEARQLANSRLVCPARLRGEPADALQAVRHGQPTITDQNQVWHEVTGLAINANALFASEVGHLLAQRSGTFGLIWQYAADGEIKASLRSEGAVDVAAIALRYGGGGHRNAAGFRLERERFFSEVLGSSMPSPL